MEFPMGKKNENKRFTEQNYNDDKFLTVCQDHTKGDFLSPQYLHPPNQSAILDTDTSISPNTTQPRTKVHTARFSPQYLYPPNSRETQGVSPSIETMASSISSSKNPPPRQVLFQQKLSPQYLYPPGDIDNLQWEINPPSTVPRFQQRLFFNFPCGNLFDTYSRSSILESNTKTGDHLSLQHLHQQKTE